MKTTKIQLIKYKRRGYRPKKIRRKELYLDPYKLCLCKRIYTVPPRKPCSGKRPIIRAEVFSLGKYTVARYHFVKFVVKTHEKTENERAKKQIRKKIRRRRIIGVFIHIPGTLNKPKIKLENPHNLHPFSHVLIRGARPQDIPGLKYAAVRRSFQARASRKGDFLPWFTRRSSKSRYSTKGDRQSHQYRIRYKGGSKVWIARKYRVRNLAKLKSIPKVYPLRKKKKFYKKFYGY